MATHFSPNLNIIAFAGSLRGGSFNAAVLSSAVELAPPGMEITVLDVSDVPFFDEDVEKVGDPTSVERLKDAVRAADGLLVFTPEYNGSVSAVTKNAIDWLSRRAGELGSPMAGKPVGIATATPGGLGGLAAREHLLQVIGFMTDALFTETLGIPDISQKMDEQNRLVDEKAIADLTAWLERFRDHVSQSAKTMEVVNL